MYKVYRDREGTNLLEAIKFEGENNANNASSIDNTDYSDDAYRKKIERLNTDVIRLRNEIAQVIYYIMLMVCLYDLICICR